MAIILFIRDINTVRSKKITFCHLPLTELKKPDIFVNKSKANKATSTSHSHQGVLRMRRLFSICPVLIQKTEGGGRGHTEPEPETCPERAPKTLQQKRQNFCCFVYRLSWILFLSLIYFSRVSGDVYSTFQEPDLKACPLSNSRST